MGYSHSRLRAADLASSSGFARRTRAVTEATGIAPRLPRLMVLAPGRSYRFYYGRVRCLGYGGRLLNRFRRRLPCGARFGVVLLEAAVFVLAARAAMARLVASRSSDRRCSHRTSVLQPDVLDRGSYRGDHVSGRPSHPERRCSQTFREFVTDSRMTQTH